MSINSPFRPYRSQKIRTNMNSRIVRSNPPVGPIKIAGRLADKDNTYITLKDEGGNFFGSLSGRRLYRLAKAIVRRFEGVGA